MRHFLVRSLGGLILSAAAFAAPFTAGSLNSFVLDEDGNPFWDNPSGDVADCNAGFYLTGGAGMGCANLKLGTPDNGLGLALGTTTALTDGAGGLVDFLIEKGTYDFTLSGSITGATDYEVGYLIGGVYTKLFGSIPASTFGDTANGIAPGGDFALYIKSDGFEFYSNDGHLRIAAFHNTDTGLYYFGFEDRDNANADYDYNDMVLTMSGNRDTTGIPEPSTYALMGAGLAALGLYRRRRA